MSDISNKVQQAKEWLQNWYKERLPILGLEHLQEQVDRGLDVPYQEVKAPYTKDQVKLPTYVAGKYILPGNRAPFRSGKRVKQPNGLVVIDTDMNDDFVETTAAHEYNHGIHFDETGRFNYDFIPGSPRVGSFTWSYYQQPWEQHSLIMELRKLNNLDPKKTTYNKEDLLQIKKHDEMSKDILNNLLQYMSEDDVINALNTWAYNSKDQDAFKVRNNVYYAKNGRQLIKHSNSVINYLNLFTND